MSRRQLPQRRESETFAIEARGREYTASISRFGDGRLAEAFFTGGKSGTDVEIAVRDAAVLLSIALQYGASVDVLRSALMRDEGGRAEGPIGVLLDTLCSAGDAV
tara:strand:- start:2865 stop:3179 length:315 start_codon:yes stop_codon:yes gene_type:complete